MRTPRPRSLFWFCPGPGVWFPSGLRLLLGLVSWVAQAQRPTLQLALVDGGGTADPTYVYFEAGASTGFDAHYDAAKLPNSSGLNLASLDAGSQPYAIKGLPPGFLNDPLTVNLSVAVPAYGFYRLRVGQLDGFAATDVYLADAVLQTRALLGPGSAHDCELTAANTANTYATSTRFALQFVPRAVPLPVVLTSFTAWAEPVGVRLAWATAAEANSAYFVVERSGDGRAFTERGRVAAAGASAAARAYTFFDGAPLAGAGLVYYRLRQVDQDGAVAYSPVRVLATGGGASALKLALYPNPAPSATTLRGAAAGGAVDVVDALGRVLLRTAAGPTGVAPLVLPVGTPSGVYWVRAAGQTVRWQVE